MSTAGHFIVIFFLTGNFQLSCSLTKSSPLFSLSFSFLSLSLSLSLSLFLPSTFPAPLGPVTPCCSRLLAGSLHQREHQRDQRERERERERERKSERIAVLRKVCAFVFFSLKLFSFFYSLVPRRGHGKKQRVVSSFFLFLSFQFPSLPCEWTVDCVKPAQKFSVLKPN